jgi:hypothetical protein
LPLILEEYGVTFEYILGKKNVVVDTLFHLDIDSLKFQEETQESLIILSKSKDSSISHIKLTKQMYIALIFKKQSKFKGLGDNLA